MSRSLHTQKLELRAARRLARPWGRRRDEAALLAGRAEGATPGAASGRRPRIVSCRPLPGTMHPLDMTRLRALLDLLGAAQIYGLRLIRLRKECRFSAAGLLFAEYVVPGEIHLYAVPTPPWRLSFIPPEGERAAFARYGARVTCDMRLSETRVEWPPAGLRAFQLCEVLAHELGHHRLWRHKGKRAAACRRLDHEKRADLHSRRTRARAMEITGDHAD